MNRELIISACIDYIESKIKDIESAINDADAGIKGETKSSAGDKYETSREMIQQDLNRYQSQLKIALEDKKLLLRITEANFVNTDKVTVGSIVDTEGGLYFISISIGVLKIQENSIFVISNQSPIGKELIGKSVNDEFRFQQKNIKIKSIY